MTFTNLLFDLAQYSQAADRRTITDTDYICFQRMEARIIEAYQAGKLQQMEYEAASKAYYLIKRRLRAILF